MVPCSKINMASCDQWGSSCFELSIETRNGQSGMPKKDNVAGVKLLGIRFSL